MTHGGLPTALLAVSQLLFYSVALSVLVPLSMLIYNVSLLFPAHILFQNNLTPFNYPSNISPAGIFSTLSGSNALTQGAAKYHQVF